MTLVVAEQMSAKLLYSFYFGLLVGKDWQEKLLGGFYLFSDILWTSFISGFIQKLNRRLFCQKMKTFGICCCNISFSLLISTCSNTLTYTPWTKCRVSKNRHTIFGACLHRFTSIQSSTLDKVRSDSYLHLRWMGLRSGTDTQASQFSHTELFNSFL